MLGSTTARPCISATLDPLDRVVIAYLTLPLAIFLIGWFEPWAAVCLLAFYAWGLLSVFARMPGDARLPVTSLQVGVAVTVGCAWTFFGGADHILFANADWHVRDAVLHDLVVSPWPVGYGLLDDRESLLRAPLGFYLPAALTGKMWGLEAAHIAMGAWTALGTTLFLLQVLSLTPSRLGVAVTVSAVIVLFSGLDIVGSLLNDGPRFRSDWNITTHLEWWAGKYQYSSMSTQLFWVPNHALGGWLSIGLMSRNRRSGALDSALPMAFVALALWSPLTAIGLTPFLLWRFVAEIIQGRIGALLRPRNWIPAVLVGLPVAGYLALDPGGIPKGMMVGGAGGDVLGDLLQQAQFFLLEAGLIGAAIFSIHRSSQLVIALLILALLPLASFGPGNDLVMRASIPSLTVLAIGACLTLTTDAEVIHRVRKKLLLGLLLLVGAVTPLAELARAAVLPAWPINTEATLIGANCGGFPAHYVARLHDQAISRVLRPPHALPLGPQGPASCDNPAIDLMWNLAGASNVASRTHSPRLPDPIQ